MEDNTQGASQEVWTKLSCQGPEKEETGALLLLQLSEELGLIWQSTSQHRGGLQGFLLPGRREKLSINIKSGKHLLFSLLAPMNQRVHSCCERGSSSGIMIRLKRQTKTTVKHVCLPLFKLYITLIPSADFFVRVFFFHCCGAGWRLSVSTVKAMLGSVLCHFCRFDPTAGKLSLFRGHKVRCDRAGNSLSRDNTCDQTVRAVWPRVKTSESSLFIIPCSRSAMWGLLHVFTQRR